MTRVTRYQDRSFLGFTAEERAMTNQAAEMLDLSSRAFARAVVLGAIRLGLAERCASAALADKPVRRRAPIIPANQWVRDEALSPPVKGDGRREDPGVWRYGVWLLIRDPELRIGNARNKGGWRLYGPGNMAIPMASSRPESQRKAADYIAVHEAEMLDTPPLPE